MSNASSGPLSGLLVADFSRILAGPYATMLMADLGADVIKVEAPAGDDTRTWVPPTRDGVSTYYLSINRNKRSVVLDLKDDGDLELARAIARRADVMIENFRPGGLAKYALDYDSVAAANAGIVYASISGFGSGGGAHLPGYDLLVQAVSGLMSLTGAPDGPPYRAGISVFDVMTGMHALIGILAALRERENSGRGQHVEVNLLSSALSGLVNQTAAYTAGGVVPHRMGNAHPSLFPYEPLPTADGDIIVIAGNDRQFRALCTALGAPALADDPRFRTVGDRTANRETLRPLLEQQLAQRTKAEWFEILVAAGVPAGPINSIAEGVEFAAGLGLEPVVEVGTGTGTGTGIGAGTAPGADTGAGTAPGADTGAGTTTDAGTGTGPEKGAGAAIPLVRNPIRFSRSQQRYDLPPPAVGEQSDEIKAEVRAWLGETR